MPGFLVINFFLEEVLRMLMKWLEVKIGLSSNSINVTPEFHYYEENT